MALGKSMGGGVMPIGALLGTERSDGLRRRLDGLDVVVAAGRVRRGARDARRVRAPSPCSRTCVALEAAGREALGALRERYEAIGDVRAVGCFMAVEFVRDRTTKERDLELQERVAWGVHPARPAARRRRRPRSTSSRRSRCRSRRWTPCSASSTRRSPRRCPHERRRGPRLGRTRELRRPRRDRASSGKEHDAVDHLEARCEAWGLPVARLPVDGAADDLLIGWSGEPALLLTAHIDTVTPTWPWEAALDGDVVRGLGAGDCKGSVIAFALGLRSHGEAGADLSVGRPRRSASTRNCSAADRS